MRSPRDSVQRVPDFPASNSAASGPPAPRRLLIVHSSAERYGSDQVCLGIAQAAVAAGWHVDALLPADGLLVQELRATGAGVTVLDTIIVRRADLSGLRPLLLPWRWGRAAMALRAYARGRAPYDVVHSNCAPTLGGALLARRADSRHVWYVHEIFTSRLERRAFDVLLRRSADVVLTCSRAVLDQFPGLAAGSHGRVVYPGVEVGGPRELRDPLSEGVPVVVCVARLNAWKGQDVLIDAIARLRARGIAVRAELVGSVFRDERQHEDRLRAQVAELGIAEYVDFLGERRDALDIVGRADIAVTPSTRPEPFGMALVEAMALGRPVVASRAGGPAEVISDGHDGLLVPAGDAVSLADALQRLIESPDEARKLGGQAQARAADFSAGSMTEQVLSTYDSLPTRGPR